MANHPSSSTPCDFDLDLDPKPSPSPSPSFRSPAPNFQQSPWYQLDLSYRSHGGRGHVDLPPLGSSTFNTNANANTSASQAPADESLDSDIIDSSLNMDLARWNEGHEVYDTTDWFKYIDLPDALPQDAGCVNVRNWMQGSPCSPLAPGVAVPWEATPRKKKRFDDIIDVLGQVLPASSTARDNATCASPASAPAPPSSQAKRSWSKCGTQSDSNDEGQCDPRKRKMGPPPVTQQTSTNNPTYPKMITQVIRPVVDEDFENSCEYCFFYLQEPYKYINKPWTSCGKPRAEISHIVTHAISDHGLIRGVNTQRKNQRYLTTCATHRSDSTKGKAGCEHCMDVEHWTEEDLADEAHEGETVCLRCYTQLPTKRMLYDHLMELNICTYKQDWPMRRKTRILYSVFCSSDVVPKFAPPPGLIRGDGARKRNEKGCRRTSQKPRTANKGPGPSRAKILPTRQKFPSSNSEFAGDVSGNYFPAPSRPALVQRQPMQSYIDVGIPQNTPEPPDYTSSFHGLHLTLPMTQAEPQSLLSSPSMPMSQTGNGSILSSPSMSMSQNESQSILSTPSLPSQYSQNMAGWMVRGNPVVKRFGYGSTDSGFVSRDNEDGDMRNGFDENMQFETKYFDDAWSDLPRG
ncbi:hypothetical protein AK830_g4592 [Neonectria ditissima]|uniref:Uncharacterized protein n=1 Tax=Neonectria ditissima TaxID=78410 RepID=A0A0P7BNI6_9HYPO|nr:hypothetical protein AK830_g4592 [Neonectria ditissima]